MYDVSTYNRLMELAGMIYGAMGRVRDQLDPPLSDLPSLLQVRSGYAESPGWYMIQAAEFVPEPLTVETLRVRDTYASPQLAQALLEMLASEQWLDRRDDGYALTDAGQTIITQLQARSARMIALVSLPVELTTRLEFLLRQLIDASLQSDTPPGEWCLRYSRRRAPSDDALALHKVLHYLADFNAFRDDAHMAAFQPYISQGYIWETFTFVMDEQATTATELFTQLAYRGYSVEDFKGALAQLVQLEWIRQNSETETFQVTEVGSAIRAEVERLTDDYFYAPWIVLTEGEQAEVITLMSELSQALQEAPQE